MSKTSCKRSFKSTVSFGRFPQFPAELQVSSQPLPSTPFQATVPFASASHLVTESFAAYSAGTQLYPQQPLPVPSSLVAIKTGPLPLQQGYLPFTDTLNRISQQQPTRLVGPTSAPSYPAYHSLVNPVEPDIHQVTVTESRCLADEFPFSYSIAKELPHIFGNLEEDEVLGRPLTPTFEPPAECEPLWDPLESYQYHGNPASMTKEDLAVEASPEHGNPHASSLSSCCYGSGEMSAPPPVRELSSGFITKGRTLRFCRQD